MTTVRLILPNAKERIIDVEPETSMTLAQFLAQAEVTLDGCSVTLTRDTVVTRVTPTEIESFLVAPGDEIAVTSQNRGA